MVVQMRKFIAVSTSIKKTEACQINNPMMHTNLLEKQEQPDPKLSDREK
jgi:hypothetical protein